MADNKDKCREGGYLPQMGKARGLIAALERIRQQERMRKQGRSLRSLSNPIAELRRGILLEAITRNPIQASNTVPCQIKRGKGL